MSVPTEGGRCLALAAASERVFLRACVLRLAAKVGA